MDKADGPEIIISLTPEKRLKTSTRFQVQSSVKKSDSPEKVDILSKADLRFRQAPSTAEALVQIPDLWLQKNFQGGAGLQIRGLGGSRSLFLIDGIRLNHGAISQSPNALLNTVDFLSLHSVELYGGAGGVVYGSDALGGSLNLLTASPDFSENGNKKLDLSAVLRYGLALNDGRRFDQERSSRAEIKFKGERVASRLGYSVRELGSLVAGQDLGPLEPSSYLALSIDFKTQFKVGKAQLLTLAFQRVSQDSLQHYGLLQTEENLETYIIDPRQRTLSYLRWEKTQDHPLSAKLRATASYQLFETQRSFRRISDTLLTREEERVGSGGFSLINQSPTKGPWTHNSGLNLYYDQASGRRSFLEDSSGRVEEGPVLFPPLTAMIRASIFSLHSHEWDKISLHAGLRYNYSRISTADDSLGDLSLDFQPLAANLGLLIKLGEYQQLRLRTESGYRNPNLSSFRWLGIPGESGSLPNPDLGSERNLHGEIGYMLRRTGLEVDVWGFVSQLSQMIERLPGTYNGDSLYGGERVFVQANQGKAQLLGASASWRWRFSKRLPWYFSGSLTYTWAENEKGLSRTPPFYGRLSLLYQWEKLSFELEAMGASAQKRLSAEDMADPRIARGGTPA